MSADSYEHSQESAAFPSSDRRNAYFLPRRRNNVLARPTPNSVMDAGSGTATGTANAGLAAIEKKRIANVVRIKGPP